MAQVPPSRPAGWAVPQLFNRGLEVKQIAPMVGLCERRVRQIVAEAGLRPPPKPIPTPAELDRIILSEAARHGGNYGFGVLNGALRAYHRQYRFPRRRVLEALQRLLPRDAARRNEWTAQRLERGRYYAPHFCYSWHLDYACKMQNYDLYIGCIIDGRTRLPVRLVVRRRPDGLATARSGGLGLTV